MREGVSADRHLLVCLHSDIWLLSSSLQKQSPLDIVRNGTRKTKQPSHWGRWVSYTEVIRLTSFPWPAGNHPRISHRNHKQLILIPRHFINKLRKRVGEGTAAFPVHVLLWGGWLYKVDEEVLPLWDLRDLYGKLLSKYQGHFSCQHSALETGRKWEPIFKQGYTLQTKVQESLDCSESESKAEAGGPSTTWKDFHKTCLWRS